MIPDAPYPYEGNIRFDLHDVPFSRYGSYLGFAHLTPGRPSIDAAPDGLYLKAYHGGGRHYFRIEVLDAGAPVAFREIATPWVLKLETAGGTVEICIAEPNGARIRAQGVGVRLTAETSNIYSNGKSRWEVNGGATKFLTCWRARRSKHRGWRGPIWAPTTMIVAEGLEAAGEIELAQEIRRRFCRTVARSGMAENFDALTGGPLRDRAYTWTSSVFLIFAHQLFAAGR